MKRLPSGWQFLDTGNPARKPNQHLTAAHGGTEFLNNDRTLSRVSWPTKWTRTPNAATEEETNVAVIPPEAT